MLTSSIIRIAIPAILCFGLLPSNAQAGPLIDWLFGRNRKPAYPVGPPIPVGGYGASYGANNAATYGNPQGGYAANYGTYYGSNLPVIGPAGAGYQAPLPNGMAATTMPQTLSYVPNYNSYANRTPVTYYRPLLTTDPNTGAQVVAMAPCTSYEYQTQRVPAFGRSALFGSNRPPAMLPAPRALPTYTLPSGGIPLAAGAPSVMLPTVRGYSPSPGTYSTLPPSAAGYSMQSPAMRMAPSGVNPAGGYPTAPLGNTAYFGSNSGGSCGNYYNPSAVPGLVAPPGPTTQPGGYPSSPGLNSPGASPTFPGSVYPQGAPSSDPADVPPSLPSTFPTNTNAQSMQRPQLRSIVRQPFGDQSPSRKTHSDGGSDESQNDTPVLMKPIPVPDGFERPRWNPGLLSEDDKTALRAITPERARVAGQAKAIQWASFESHRFEKPQTSSRLRPIADESNEASPPWNSQSGSYSAPLLPPATPLEPAPQPVRAEPRRYDNTGWKTSR